MKQNIAVAYLGYVILSISLKIVDVYCHVCAYFVIHDIVEPIKYLYSTRVYAMPQQPLCHGLLWIFKDHTLDFGHSALI